MLNVIPAAADLLPVSMTIVLLVIRRGPIIPQTTGVRDGIAFATVAAPCAEQSTLGLMHGQPHATARL